MCREASSPLSFMPVRNRRRLTRILRLSGLRRRAGAGDAAQMMRTSAQSGDGMAGAYSIHTTIVGPKPVASYTW